MTTNIRIELFGTASEGNFQYVQSPGIAVLSVIGERDVPSTSLTVVLGACVERLRPLLREWLAVAPERSVHLFAATPYWSEPGVVARHRGIWGLDTLRWLPANASRSTSVEILSEGSSRFAGLAQLPEEALADAADFVRLNSSSMLFVAPSGGISEDDVRSVFKLAFPEGEASLNWASAVTSVADSNHILLRASGGFDDREVAIDALMPTQLFETVSSGGYMAD